MQERGFIEWSGKVSLKKITLGERHERKWVRKPCRYLGSKKGAAEQRSLGRNMPVLLKPEKASRADAK